MNITTDRTNLNENQTPLLEDRFILTQLQNYTLVFPATWVTEILRVDRSHILTLPFYNPLIFGIVDLNGQTIPLINTAKLFRLADSYVLERLLIVRLNQTAERLNNLALIVDRLIGSTTRSELPPEIFTTYQSNNMLMIQSHLISADLWTPQNLSSIKSVV